MSSAPALRDLLATSPAPLAQLVRRVLNARAGTEHHAATFYVLEATLKLAASARVSLLLEERDKLDASLAKKLEAVLLPSLGHWCSFLADANRALAKRGDATSELAKCARELSRPLTTTSALSRFIDAACEADLVSEESARSTRKAGILGFFEAFVAYRNQVLGHGALRSSAFYERFALLFRDVIAELISNPALLGSGELAIAVPDTDAAPPENCATSLRWKSLVGLAGVLSDEPANGAKSNELYLRYPDRIVSLAPFVICEEDDLGRERFGFLNRGVEGKGGAVKRTDYLDYATGEELRDVDARQAITALLARLRNKEVGAAEVRALEATLIAEEATEDGPLVDPTRQAMLGRKLGGKYEVLRLVGEGGMANVYEGRHVDLGERRLAIKVLHPDLCRRADVANRFRAEAKQMSQLDHPGIVDVTDFGREPDGTVFFVMEMLSGASLDRWVDLESPSLDRIVAVVAEALEALSFAHSRGLVHRDLKPQNLFLAKTTRGDDQVKVLDFGIAKVLEGDGAATSDGMLLGTPRYMSPEQISRPREVDARADVYSMGATLFQLLTGIPPVDGAGAIDVVAKVNAGDIERHPRNVRPDIPALLDSVVAKALERDPKARFASASEMRTALLAAGAEAVVTTAKTEIAEASTRRVSAPTEVERTKPTGDTALDAAISDRSLAAQSATIDATLRSARPSGSWLKGAALAFAVLAVSVVLWLTLVQQKPMSKNLAVASAEPKTSAAPALRQPVLGERALSTFHDPKPSSIGLLDSASYWADALRDFEEAAKQPGAPPRWAAAKTFCEGEVALQSGDLKKAEEAFKASAALDPTWATPLSVLGSVLGRDQRIEDALDAAQSAERLEPAWVGAIRTEAIVHEHAGHGAEAIQAFRRALELAPNDGVTLGDLALAYHGTGLDSEAERYGKQSLDADPDQATVRLMLAEVALEKKNGAEALEQATRALAIEPNQTAILLARGDAFALLDKKEEALTSYRNALAAYRATGDKTSLKGRLAEVAAAIEKGELPPPRGEAKPAPGKPTQTTHQRTACPPGDPLCSAVQE